MGVPLTAAAIFSNRTISALAAAVDALRPPPDPSRPDPPEGLAAPLLTGSERGGGGGGGVGALGSEYGTSEGGSGGPGREARRAAKTSKSARCQHPARLTYTSVQSLARLLFCWPGDARRCGVRL